MSAEVNTEAILDMQCKLYRWSREDAVARLVRLLHQTPHGPSRFVLAIEGDIKGCFDAIDHHLLMERLQFRIKDRKVLRLIQGFLKAGIMAEGRIRNPVTGTPQGGIISPLLANVYLTAVDERYRRWTPGPQRNDDQRHETAAGGTTPRANRPSTSCAMRTTSSSLSPARSRTA